MHFWSLDIYIRFQIITTEFNFKNFCENMSHHQEKKPKSFTEKCKTTATYKYHQQQIAISRQKEKEEKQKERESLSSIIQESREKGLKRIKEVHENFLKSTENPKFSENFHLKKGDYDRDAEDDNMSIASRPENMDKMPAHLQYPASDLNIHAAMDVSGGYKVNAKIEKVLMSKSTPQKRPYNFIGTKNDPPPPPPKFSTPTKPTSKSDIQSTSKMTKNFKKPEYKTTPTYDQENQHFQKNFNYYKKFRSEMQLNSKLAKKLEEKDKEIEKLAADKQQLKNDYEKRIESLEGLLRLAIKN